MIERVILKRGATQKLRYLPETAKTLEGFGAKLKAACNRSLDDEDEPEGYRMSSRKGAKRPFGRHRVTVITVTRRARRHDRRHNTLIRELGKL